MESFDILKFHLIRVMLALLTFFDRLQPLKIIVPVTINAQASS